MILTRKELDGKGCSTPDCGHDHSELYLVARCHPDEGLNVRYVKATGNLVIECSKCECVAAEIAVARWRADDEKHGVGWAFGERHGR